MFVCIAKWKAETNVWKFTRQSEVQVLRRKIEIDIKSKEQNWQGSDHSHNSVHVFKIN